VLNRILTSLAGFFVYITNLLAYVTMPAQMSKPELAGGFAAIAVLCAAVALTRARFAGWQRVLGGILIGASLTSVVAVAAITGLRSADAIRHTIGAEQLQAFNDYRSGGTVSGILLACGSVLVWAAHRGRASSSQQKKNRHAR
jgi:hypothetical protein